MKILISFDLEGVAGVVNWQETESKSPRYSAVCKQGTAEVNAAIAGAREVNPDIEFLIADSHATGTNLLPEELDPTVSIIRGTPRSLYMMHGIDDTIDAVFYIGYHSMVGSEASPMDHTYSGAVVHRATVNGVAMSELDINARVAGHFGARLGMVTGNQDICDHARSLYGQAFATVSTKRGISRFAAECRPLRDVIEDIHKSAGDAIRMFDHLPVVAENLPIVGEIEYLSTVMADLASMVPTVTRIDGRTLRFEVPDMPTYYKTFMTCVIMGAAARQ